jgi:hypothetical protein
MEANRKERCDFSVQYKGEQWDIQMAWIGKGNVVAWYDGRTVREGTSFYRTFEPSEITIPQIDHDKGEM